MQGVPHETMGDELKGFFDSCGAIIKVLRSVDVRERSAFIAFTSPYAAKQAVKRSGELLRGQELTVKMAAEKGANGVAPMDELGEGHAG